MNKVKFGIGCLLWIGIWGLVEYWLMYHLFATKKYGNAGIGQGGIEAFVTLVICVIALFPPFAILVDRITGYNTRNQK